ncbi:hypothetical protein [Zunongwangia endophytica]|uniref:Uncharacterized protein n=1 Tax=Zunongwangia endophytica TaxID=1808945 RepID=A0ABV8HC06_9FLAO|nr:hypothetical protein [Zunongwangia endophytica]MDN3594182.1 hypothetical protein [Zunongwangia endophytica]
MTQQNLDLIFNIFGAIGSLATFGAFLFLFRRDKDKQTQIDKLTGIATFLEAQNETMKDQNELISQQVEIFRNTSILKEQDDKALSELKAIEEKKLKLSVKPNLWLNGAGYSGIDGELKIDLNNKGEEARLLEFRLNSNDIILHSESLPYDLEKGQRRYIFGRQSGNIHIKDCEYEIDVVYQDKLENKYVSKIVGKGASAKITETKEV